MTGPSTSPARPGVLASVQKTAAAQALRRRLELGGTLSLGSVTSAAHAFFSALVGSFDPGRLVMIVASDLKSQESIHADLTTWARLEHPEARLPLFYPGWEVLPHEKKLPHSDVISERLETLVALSGADTHTHGATVRPQYLVTSALALLQRTFPADAIQQRTRRLNRGQTINPLDLIEWLEEQGYEPESQVTSKGELSWRGGIVDVWPLSSPWPVRLEFFGDEIESIREFDPHNQLSRETVETVILPPAGELGLLRKSPLALTVAIAETGPGAETTKTPDVPLGSILDHLPADAIVILCDPQSLLSHAVRYQQQVPAGDPFIGTWDATLGDLKRRGFTCVELTEEAADSDGRIVDLSPLSEILPPVPRPLPVPDGHERRQAKSRTKSTRSVDAVLVLRSLEAYRPITNTLPEPQVAEAQRRQFFAQLHRWLRQDYLVVVFCNNDGERERFGEIWAEQGFDSGANDPQSIQLPTLQVGGLSRGFLSDQARVVVVTDAEIFGRYKVARPRRLKSAHAQVYRSAFEIDFTDFEEGDFVVHLQNGIGIYRGLKTLAATRNKPGSNRSQDLGQECLVIEFAPRDADSEPPKLYVPVSEAHLVSKYVGAGKARPQLSTIGGARWAKSKEQAEHAVRDLAAELLKVQAVRATQLGHPFKTDSSWQREFESSFLYEETPDQLKAIAAAKQDMESAKPMDRLLCGDVGFGKTEVAIRAAFKAVMGGKQVAILVPTTVLAQQHYNNFRERMADYPVRIELLSRFRTPKQPRAVLEAAASGAVDIVIGTHRIVQADTVFKDLGLVVVDEEQKFGVKHKETFKLLRQTVDVLTLSATPIPRTLYLALTGARDLSTLETPPQDRLPVETIVTNYDERVIRDAIVREINRGGQTYFLHNRVSTIEAVALRIQALVPDARVVIGHGQMDDHQLEKAMTTFVNGDADVLVSTTIIESGLDIPNANTIIIDRADRFGLSDLYQLRGRVGRYKHQAYCYLLLPRHAQLLTEARKRMSAIKQYSALGSGFKIAMRDLEIRGAGNLLGAEQSGHITAVGFDLYCQLLARSISTLKGETPKTRLEVRTQFDFLAMHPGQELEVGETSIFGPDPAGGSNLPKRLKLNVQVPRETYSYSDWDDDSSTSIREEVSRNPDPTTRAPAYLPLDYVREPEQRVDVYRKLGLISDRDDIQKFHEELRDRFGPVPRPVEFLLAVGELRWIAAERGVSSIEVIDGKIKLTRRGDLITVGGQFPRLTKKEARARLSEIKQLLLSLEPVKNSPESAGQMKRPDK